MNSYWILLRLLIETWTERAQLTVLISLFKSIHTFGAFEFALLAAYRCFVFVHKKHAKLSQMKEKEEEKQNSRAKNNGYSMQKICVNQF